MNEFSVWIKKKLPKGGIYIIIAFGILGYIIANWEPVKEFSMDVIDIIQSESLFKKEGASYNILMCPTNKLSQNNNVNVILILQERLKRIADRENVNMKIRYLDKTLNFENYTSEDWKNLLKKHNAHVVIFGNQFAPRFDSESDMISVNYVAKSNIPKTGIELNSQNNKLVSYRIEDIQEGKISAEIESAIFFFLAVSKYDGEDYDGALNLLENSRQHKTLFEVKSLLSFIYWRKGDYSKALFYNNEALEIQHNSKHRIRDRMILFVNSGRYSEAINLFEKVIGDFDDDSELYNNVGMAYFYLGYAEKALEKYNFCLEIDKENRQIFYYNRALANKKIGNYEDAIRDYLKAIRLLVNNKDSLRTTRNIYTAIGVVKVKQGKLEEALKYHNLEISHYPNSVLGYYNRSIVYHKLGRNDNRLRDVNKCIALNPSFADAYIARGYCYLQQKQISRAKQDFITAVKVDSLNAKSYLHLGVFYNEARNPDSALYYLNYALKLGCNSDPECDLALLYATRGIAKARLKDYDSALEDLLMAKSEGKNDTALYHNIGATYLYKEDTIKACENWKISAEMGSSLSKILMHEFCQ